MSAGNFCAPTEKQPSPAAAWLTALVCSALFFAVIFPTLGWLGFYNGTEKISVATALQTRRDGNWLLPLLDGRPRFVKPPLTMWETAATLRQQTVRDIGNPDPAIRRPAFHQFEIETRIWPLVSCCIILLAVFEFGRVIGGPRLGLTAELVCASTFLFLRFSRLATSDVQLALWVSLADVFLAYALFDGRRWLGCIGAAIALGLALMSKGPVALVESLLPALAFIPFRDEEDKKTGSWTLPILVGIALMLLIELPWYIYILHRLGNVWHKFRNEITGEDSPDRASPWYSYLGFLWLFLPWLPLLVLGAIVAVQESLTRPKSQAVGNISRRLLLALLLFVIPLLVLSFFKDKRDRYVVPMLPPAAVLAAAGAVQCARGIRARLPDARAWLAVHFVPLAAMATALPLLGAFGHVPAFSTPDAKHIYTAPMAVGVVAVCWTLIAIGIALRRRAGAWVTVTVAVMLLLQTIFFLGYRQTPQGTSSAEPLAEAIWAQYPDAQIVNVDGSSALGPNELSIYLDRIFAPIRGDAAIKLQPGPQPIIALVKEPQGDPASGSAQLLTTFVGWRVFDKIRYDNQLWYVLLLPAKGP
jgi:4-amino-4-deoxy-L-arabinose transferase-like glycosyltransferase